MQKENDKAHIVVVRKKRRFAVSMPHSKEQHTDVESLADHVYSGIKDGITVNHFLQGKEALSWRQGSIWTQLESLSKILIWCVLSWSNGHKKELKCSICPNCHDGKSASETWSGNLHRKGRVKEIPQGNLEFYVQRAVDAVEKITRKARHQARHEAE